MARELEVREIMVRSRYRKDISFFSNASRPLLGRTQSPIELIPGAVFPLVKWLGLEADHSPTSSAEVRMSGCLSPFPIRFYVVHRENFQFM